MRVKWDIKYQVAKVEGKYRNQLLIDLNFESLMWLPLVNTQMSLNQTLGLGANLGINPWKSKYHHQE